MELENLLKELGIKEASQEEEVKRVSFTPETCDVWDFSYCDHRFGTKGYLGRIPGQYVQNILYYMEHDIEPTLFYGRITKVVDPMAGSGTTQDVVKWYNLYFSRDIKCFSYDLNPTREFIKYNDLDQGLPEEAKDCDLIVFDPPYYNMKKYNPGGYSDYLTFYKKIFQWAGEIYKVLRPGGCVAFFISDYYSGVSKYKEPLSMNCSQLFFKAGFKHRIRIPAPVRNPFTQNNKFMHLLREIWFLEKYEKEA